MKIALTAAEAITPVSTIYHPVLLMEDGVITGLGPKARLEVPKEARHLDFPDAILAPGFVDVHIHGGAGHDVMEGSPSALDAIESFIARHGVTSYCPTTVTAPVDATLSALEKLGVAIRVWNGKNGNLRACPVGIHLEGPFISTAKCGVHPVKEIVPPSKELFGRFWDASAGLITVATIAPELPGAVDFIRDLTSRGVRVSLGHSNAEAAPTHAAIAAGARHTTHTFNAMRALDHREPGILGVALSDDKLSADIIADGIHVNPDLVKVFLAAKGEERAVLITDAISATGMPDGTYRLGNFEVQVKGHTCLSGGRLAGSVLTMDLAVRNIMSFANWRLMQSVRLATLNPARLLGIDGRKGMLAVGKEADINVLTRDGKVLQTIVGGRLA